MCSSKIKAQVAWAKCHFRCTARYPRSFQDHHHEGWSCQQPGTSDSPRITFLIENGSPFSRDNIFIFCGGKVSIRPIRVFPCLPATGAVQQCCEAWRPKRNTVSAERGVLPGGPGVAFWAPPVKSEIASLFQATSRCCSNQKRGFVGPTQGITTYPCMKHPPQNPRTGEDLRYHWHFAYLFILIHPKPRKTMFFTDIKKIKGLFVALSHDHPFMTISAACLAPIIQLQNWFKAAPVTWWWGCPPPKCVDADWDDIC